jgi:fermentation-respiration switch protein FrsA (DUF1100 family)
MLTIGLRILIFLFLLVVVLRLFENKLIFHPHSLAPGALAELTAGVPAMTGTFEEVSIETADGVTITGWFGKPANPRGYLLWFHGNAGNVTHRWPDFLTFVSAAKLAVLIVDYRGFGASQGKPHEAGLYLDSRAAYDYLMSRGATPENTVILGRSIGGAVAIELAGEREAAGLILESTFLNIGEMAKRTFPLLPLHWLAASRFQSDERIGALTLPILFFHGTADEIVPFQQGKALADLAGEGNLTFIPVEGAGHNDLSGVMGVAYFDTVREFVERSVGD